jgi:hypothetical protein
MSGPVSITEINTSVTIIDRTIMPALIEDEGAVFAAISRDAIRRADQRDYIISILLEIAEATTLALSEADIRIPVFFAVPRSARLSAFSIECRSMRRSKRCLQRQ